MKEKERSLEEKYELAKMVLMLIERFSLALMVGQVPSEHAMDTIRQIGNAAHVANHENGEVTFDCGPKRDEHHAGAIAEYQELFATMLLDIAQGTDYSNMIGYKLSGMGEMTHEPPEVDL